MAWRIDESVVRGEIDNRQRGRVTGRIWFVGRDAPVELDLAGNAWRDLAGRRLLFVNPAPKSEDLSGLANRQTGVIGDCTASRKVRVPEISMEELMERYKRREDFPWHWGNSLYLEWFSAPNGRVVIESTSYELTIDGMAAWTLSTEEEEAQRRVNIEAMGGFMQQTVEAIAARQKDQSRPPPDDAPEWEWKPMTEEEAEQMQADSDRLADRIQARIAREGEGADYERILEEELERRRIERGDPPPTPEQEAQREAWLEEMNRAAEEALANPDPELDAELDRRHPLVERTSDLAVALHRVPRDRGWLPPDAGEEHPLQDMAFAMMKAGAKLAGALNGDWPVSLDCCGHAIVRLKRARSCCDDALLALECCLQQQLADVEWCTSQQREINAIAHECDLLLGEFRARLQRGFD